MNYDFVKKLNLPDSPGIYIFKCEDKILYIGKATSLKDRVNSYFSNDLIKTRGSRIVDMVSISDNLNFTKTDSVLEALVLEALLIKKHQPKYNILEKDNKSFNYVIITNDEYPKVLIRRERNLKFEKSKYIGIFGPFTMQKQLIDALKIIRKIFPFYGEKSSSKIYEQIGLEPAEISKKDYMKNILNIRLFFQGKKQKILKSLEKDMMKFAKNQEFEKANLVKRKIFALNHIKDVSLIKDENIKTSTDYRIESYDIAHLKGTNSVGVMTVVEDSEVKKSDYRKFIIRKAKKGDDVGALREIITRRLTHPEWTFPNLIVIDGGKGQLNMAKGLIDELGLVIDVVSVLKDEKHKPKNILGKKDIIQDHKKDILISNSEAHRFAIEFYRKTHRKKMK